MPDGALPSPPTTDTALRTLYWLRWVFIAGQAAVLLWAPRLLGLTPERGLLIAIIAALAFVNLGVALRLRFGFPSPRWEAPLHLTGDILALTALLYFSGGPTSPFVSLYLVPLAIAAAILPPLQAFALAALCALTYSGLMWSYRPLAHPHGDAFDLHVLGMWINFMFSALLIAGFVTALAGALRRRDQALARARERSLHDQQLLSLAALAAGAAHELSTPLATMLLSVGELEAQVSDPQARRDLATLRAQIALCKERLGELLTQHPGQLAADEEPRALHLWLEELAANWRLLRPDVELRCDIAPSCRDLRLCPPPTLAQGLQSLLDNAVDAAHAAGQRQIGLQAQARDERLYLAVTDPGAGPVPDARLGSFRFSTKPGGHGLGLALARFAAEQLGGRLELTARPGGGAQATMELPLRGLAADARA